MYKVYVNKTVLTTMPVFTIRELHERFLRTDRINYRTTLLKKCESHLSIVYDPASQCQNDILSEQNSFNLIDSYFPCIFFTLKNSMIASIKAKFCTLV